MTSDLLQDLDVILSQFIISYKDIIYEYTELFNLFRKPFQTKL